MDGVQKPAQDTCPESFELVNAADDLEAKVTKLGEDLASVKNDIGAIKTLLEEDSKQKTLERALQLVNVGSFTYYNQTYDERSSTPLAKQAIEHFLLGSGYQLSWGGSDIVDNEEDRQAFRLKFIARNS